MHATPGGPWDTSEKPIPADVQEKLKAAYGLDKPLWEQYVVFLGKALQGDLGPSYTQRSRTVSDIIGETFPVSLQLGRGQRSLIAIARRHSARDPWRGAAQPSARLSLDLRLRPRHLHASRMWSPRCWCWCWRASSISSPPAAGTASGSTKAIVPAISLALYPTAVLARYTRSSMLEVLRTDYMRTARAKGLREGAVLLRHGVRNALLPVITIAGIVLADVATGAFFVETIYQVPGVGRYFVQSIAGRDYPVILGTVLVLGLTVSLMNLIVDLLYPLLDPRIGSR